MLIDTHVHTSDFSRDSKMPLDHLLQLTDSHSDLFFCTTEHYDYDFYRPENALVVDPMDYTHRFLQKKIEYESSTGTPFPILFGIEYGYLSHLASFYDNLTELIKFDSVICSVHCVEGVDPYFDRQIYAKGKKYTYGLYLETIIEMLEQCEGFDIVGHYDYIARYAPYPDKVIRYREFPDHFDRIFSLCISGGKALELNTKTSAALSESQGKCELFDEDILKRYHELGGELISLGSDAHEIQSVFRLFEETIELLKTHHFTNLTYYINRIPHWISL